MSDVAPQELLPLVINAVEHAGLLLSAEWNRSAGPRGFDDKADVDVKIEVVLKGQLLQLISCDFWGEETGNELTGDAWCWVVDPNDGTSDFLKGIKGSAISVGLLHNNIPVLGVVHAPITVQGIYDTIGWAEGMPYLVRNGDHLVIDLSGWTLSSNSTVMVSAAADKKSQINLELYSPATYHPMPSIAYRLARVAAGDGVCGVSLHPVSAHDVIAGALTHFRMVFLDGPVRLAI